MAYNEKYNNSDFIGKKYNMLTVIEPVKHICGNGNKQWYWKAKCDCGNEAVVRPFDVIKEKVVSCGCYRKSGKQAPSTHKESHTHLHNVWCGMNNRCNPSHAHSDRYGKRGIRVCDEWSDYTKFAEWARTHGYEEGLTIERIDVNGNYEPNNCCWIPPGKQARNRRTTHWVEYKGEKMSLAEACERAELPYKQVFERIVKRGWSVERALSEPMHRESRLRMICRERGLNYNLVYNRIHTYGWSEEDAINIPNAGKGANQKTYNHKK